MTITMHRLATGCYIVQASAQFYLRAVEDPLPYQQFFRALEQAIFLEGRLVE